MSGKDNMSEVMAQVMRNRLAETHVSMPARVVSYDYKTQKASVQPTINRKYTDGREESFPIIESVPVVFPRSGGASLTFPVLAGDTVMLVFSDREMDTWLNSGGVQSPQDRRIHSLNDAVAIPGLFPFSEASPAENNEDVLLSYDDAKVRVKKSGKIEITTTDTVNVVGADQVNVESDTVIDLDAPLVRINGTLGADGDHVTIRARQLLTIDAGPRPIARVGDLVAVGAGSSAGLWPIVTGSPHCRIDNDEGVAE